MVLWNQRSRRLAGLALLCLLIAGAWLGIALILNELIGLIAGTDSAVRVSVGWRTLVQRTRGILSFVIAAVPAFLCGFWLWARFVVRRGLIDVETWNAIVGANEGSGEAENQISATGSTQWGTWFLLVVMFAGGFALAGGHVVNGLYHGWSAVRQRMSFPTALYLSYDNVGVSLIGITVGGAIGSWLAAKMFRLMFRKRAGRRPED